MELSESKIRVLHIVDNLDQGGIESYLMSIIRIYDRQRFQMDFCYKGKREGIMAQEARCLGSNITACPMTFGQVRFIRRFVKLLKTENYDIVNSHVCELSGSVVYAAALANVPVKISSYHNTANTSMEGLVKKLPFLKPIRNYYMGVCHRAVLKYSNGITGCSTAALNAYFPERQQNDRRFRVIHYGVDLNRFVKSSRQAARKLLGIGQDKLVVGHIGRFNLPKDHKTFVKAAEIVVKKVPQAVFLLVGDGYLRPEIEQMVKERGLEERFIFTGVRSDVPVVLSAMDLMLFPSVAEGLPVSVIEAQAASVPVVASDLPSIRETLCNPLQQFMAGCGDYGKFAANVIELLQNGKKRESLVSEELEFVKQHFSQQAAIKSLTDFYEELIAKAGKGAL